MAVLVALLLPAVASAAVPVTITADEQDGECSSDCSLRDAVLIAGRTGDVVTVPAGTYTLTLGATLGEIPLNGLSIQGAGARTTVIDGNNASRVLRVGTGANEISGVTITRGTGTGGQFGGSGGGILVQSGATLSLTNSAVSGNTSPNDGGGIATAGTLTVVGSTISGNQAQGRAGSGGGFFLSGGTTTLTNSTISGNTAPSLGGGVFINTGTLRTQNATIAGNQAFNGGGIYNSDGSAILVNTIVADSLQGGGCNSFGIDQQQSHHNIDDDNTCGLSATRGDKPNTDPMLGLLANNGGPTDTHALSPVSPAINAADPMSCPATDQRGVLRSACDMGAFEYVNPTLRVVTQVINDHGGTRDPSEFSVHVTAGADVAGSPQPGSAGGVTYTLAGGTYTVSADALAKYAIAVSGDCAAAGTVSLAESEAKTCTIVANDPAPVAGMNVNAIPKSGTVRIKLPGRNRRFRKLVEGEQIPLGTTIDTLKGRVTLVAAANKTGKIAMADFYEGVVKVLQTKGANPITRIVLVEKLSCPKAGKASIAATRKKRRRIWGDGSGRFRTEGEFSSATVRGTRWLTQDHCDRTWTKVARGRVAVRDFVKKKTIIVRGGKQYIARAKKK